MLKQCRCCRTMKNIQGGKEICKRCEKEFELKPKITFTCEEIINRIEELLEYNREWTANCNNKKVVLKIRNLLKMRKQKNG